MSLETDPLVQYLSNQHTCAHITHTYTCLYYTYWFFGINSMHSVVKKRVNTVYESLELLYTRHVCSYNLIVNRPIIVDIELLTYI